MKRNIRLLSVILIIALSSCQKEDIYQENKPNSLKVKEITFSNAKEIKILDNALTKVFEGIKSHNRNTGPVADNDFTIDQSEKVKVMSDGNSTTYTMLIKRATENPAYFENLVIMIDNDSQTKAYIFKYIPIEETHHVAVHNELSFKGSFEVHEILYNSSVFQPLVNLSGCGNIALCDYGGDVHNAGENCTQTYYVAGNCDASVPDGSGASSPIYTAPVGSPAGGSAPLRGNVLKMNIFLNNLSMPKQDLFATFPQGTQDAIFNYLVANNFANGSNTKVSSFLQSIISNNLTSYFTDSLTVTEINPDFEGSINSIFNYLIQNNFSLQSTNLVNQLISASITNDLTLTFSSSVNATNAMVVNNINDISNCFPVQSTPSTTSSITSVTGNERIISAKIKVNALIDLDVDIKQSTVSPFAVTNVTSDFSGITFGNTWNQKDYSTNVNNAYGMTSIDITGTQTVSVFMNGIGTILTKKKHYQLHMTTSTGVVYGTIEIN